MSNDLNSCSFIGRLGKAPEMRYMPNGEAVTSFSIAVSSSWNDKNSGQKKEQTEWINVTAFDKLGEICGQYLTKGSQVFIGGRMKTDKYTDKDDIEKYSTKIIADKMQMLGAKQDGQGGDSNPPPTRQQEPKPKPNFNDMDDDIPF